WLFQKYMLPCLQCQQCLGGMLCIPANDQHNVDVRVVQNLVVFGAAGIGAETESITLAPWTVGREHGAQMGVRNLLQVRQMYPTCEIARSHQSHPQCVALGTGCRG